VLDTYVTYALVAYNLPRGGAYLLGREGHLFDEAREALANVRKNCEWLLVKISQVDKGVVVLFKKFGR
jgi:hypothetical protein